MPNRLTPLARVIVAAALVVVTAAACQSSGSGASGTGGLSADAPIPEAVPQGTTLVVADDANRLKTLFKLSGEQDRLSADVSYANFSSGPLRLEAIRSGNAQLGRVGDVPPILAQYSDAGVPIVGAVKYDGNGLVLATSPKSGIASLKDLAGKKIAINEGTAQQAVVLRNLKSAGLTIKDVQPVNLGLAEFADGLRAEQVNAAVLKQPDRVRYLASTEGEGSIEIPNAPGAYPGLYYVYASQEALSDPARAAAIREFVIAWYRAENWLNENKQTWIDEYLIKDQKVSPEDARAIAEADGRTSVPGFTEELIATQQETIDLLQESGGFAGKELRAKDEFDSRFADLNANSAGDQ
ncbi:ABC transporter substrate-binding protein [Mycolicibacterium sp. HK-90]|uniref:ABC transporter substrate-binding protein n=1 Tax=Mycolicibacterium sp. HK-90 TaxID=3056937 RepID=UPI00265B3625|nr:ABC transporter substrate-binding protein [Mycolicibacterium sp. HK-90]WKG01939.1 ABC transporter substrate-binding protein [Mycolicibacterium sp. HK-90]